MLKNISLKTDAGYLFKDLSFSPRAGKWTAILGKSGVGKTTIIRILAGLDVFGQLSGKINLTASVSWMGQQDGLYPWLSVLDNVLLSISIRKKPTASDISSAKELLDLVGCISKINCAPQELSGGERRRIALVRTLMNKSDIILMDEPFSSLDGVTMRHCQNLFYKMLAKKTVIIITHSLAEATRLASDIFILANHSPSHFSSREPATKKIDHCGAKLEFACNLKSLAPRNPSCTEVLSAVELLWDKLDS